MCCFSIYPLFFALLICCTVQLIFLWLWTIVRFCFSSDVTQGNTEDAHMIHCVLAVCYMLKFLINLISVHWYFLSRQLNIYSQFIWSDCRSSRQFFFHSPLPLDSSISIAVSSALEWAGASLTGTNVLYKDSSETWPSKARWVANRSIHSPEMHFLLTRVIIQCECLPHLPLSCLLSGYPVQVSIR